MVQKCNENLPEEQSFLLLPLLMDVAIADDDSIKRSFAKEAVLNINAFFEFKQRTRHIYSFQLAQLIYHAQHLHDYYTLPPNIGTESNRRISTPSSNDPLVAEKIDASIRDTNTLQSDNYKKWNWDLILALLKSIVSMRECNGRAVITEHDLLSKNSVYYYLFLGRLSKSSVGTQALMESDIFVRLSEMLKMDDEFATSAIVALSSFNYYYESPCRTYLTQALKSHCTALRLYSTSLLRVVLRSNPVAFGSWGLSLLITQLHDTNQQVLIETVSVLDEALEDRRLVNLFHKLWEAFSTIKNLSGFLTQIYHLATARLSSIPFNQVQHDDKHLSMIREELAYWDTTFNTEYVTLIETKLFSAYSGGSLLTDDYFERRKTTSVTNKTKIKKSSAHVSSHLYRQLCLHPEGFRLLRSESRLEKYVTELRQHRTNCISVNETRVIKEALWALANTASTEYGYSWFVEKDLLPDFLRFAEECQNLSVRGTAFYALSLIAQTPDGAISLKDFGWETYRVRSHSIPPSVANTDTCQSTERRISKGIMASSPRKSISLQVTPPVISTINNLPDNKTSLNLNEPATADALPTNRFNLHKDSTSSDVKSRRSFTMPSSILLNSNEKTDVLHVIIPEESAPATPTSNIAMVSFSDCLETSGHPLLVSVPIRRCSSISKELTNVATCRDSGIASGATGSFSDFECSRSPSYQTYPSHSQSQSAAEQSATDSLPLERFRPRSKSAHQSNALRQSKQLQKVPEVIQALRAPTAGLGAASEPSATDELYRSRLLRCNFLLKPDAAGYEYARRVQKISHATYSHLVNTNYNDFYADDMLLKEKKDELLLPFQRYRSKFYKKIYESHDVHDQQIDKFLTDDGKYSSDQRDLDDADEDGNTLYRGLAVPVDIRQVVEISDGYNLNCETWSDLVRSRSRGNTNADQARTRSATGASISSGEFTSTSPAVGSQDQMMSTTIIVPTNPMPSTPSLNICMMCINNTTSLTPHENPHITMQADFDDVKSLASRLIAAIHTDEVEKKLLSWKESRPRIFDNICLYSEICYILTLSSVRVSAQRFLHDLFSDCQFEKLRKRRRQVDVLREEEDDDSLDTSTSSQ
ncbi:unnamed protein product [Rotaria magnacalcarata]|uniref:Rapamycin-insensitive companion of mTOR n=1 Tax=Rotaria magnacalcarata TaxID=392030 RepID=A0A8S2L9J4_9BILA|nr:unnamed protein product [Rotaria magnacalcarata]